MSQALVRVGGVAFSLGNRKLGYQPSVSLLPRLSCGKHCGTKLLCRRDCYAVKMQNYTYVEPSWTENYRIWKQNPSAYFSRIIDFLGNPKRKVGRFRWHVGGDIPDAEYLAEIVRMARRFPSVQFWTFTKAYELLPVRHPEEPNLRILVSHWPGMETPTVRRLVGYAHAWVVPNPASQAVKAGRLAHPDYKIPDDAQECPGNCATCELCCNIMAEESVKFDQH